MKLFKKKTLKKDQIRFSNYHDNILVPTEKQPETGPTVCVTSHGTYLRPCNTRLYTLECIDAVSNVYEYDNSHTRIHLVVVVGI